MRHDRRPKLILVASPALLGFSPLIQSGVGDLIKHFGLVWEFEVRTLPILLNAVPEDTALIFDPAIPAPSDLRAFHGWLNEALDQGCSVIYPGLALRIGPAIGSPMVLGILHFLEGMQREFRSAIGSGKIPQTWANGSNS